MDRVFIYSVLLINLGVAISFYVRSRCEVPFFIAFFNILVEYRLLAIQYKFTDWVNFDYGISFVFNEANGKIVSDLIVLGSSLLMYSFIYFYKPGSKKINDSNLALKKFVQLKGSFIIIGLIIFSFLQAITRNTGGSYGIYIKLANSSFIILLFLLAYFTETRKGNIKILYYCLFVILAWLTYSTSLRFQFLGWIIPIAYFFLRDLKPATKIISFFFGLFFILVIFSSAGVLRNSSIESLTWSEFYDESVERMLVAEDINFIDGFIMMYQIYPKKLDFTFGLQHVEIFLRPIPRSLWPGKPLAGWVQNYTATYKTAAVNVGFSPTLYGVFYAEMGLIGIIVLSIVWGKLLCYLYAALQRFKSDLWAILTGVMLASMIPIFRSGDLAGDFSIVLMSYWPLIIFAVQYKKFLKKSHRINVK